MNMGTRRTRPAKSTRFNLLLLEEGEYFLDDYRAFRFLEPIASTYRKVQGRLKVCTRGLYFVPVDIFLPILRFSFRSITAFPRIEHFEGSSTSKELCCIAFEASDLVEMRERGVDHPYIYRETLTSHHIPMTFRFTLVYSLLDLFLDSIRPIFSINQFHLNTIEEQQYLTPILQTRLITEFDPSLLVDFRETIISRTTEGTRIEPLLSHPGCIVLTNQRIYFQPAKINNLVDPVLHWEYSSIQHLYKRRYLLRQTGLELEIKKSDRTFFFTFTTRESRDQVYACIVNQHPTLESNRTSMEEMLSKWQQREIDNYEYLMYLNNTAGRTRNDLTQYPVFPWVLCDYTSSELDLLNPQTFRDLSKPMGALTSVRLTYFRDRYNMMPRGEEVEGMPPPFLYGTHYSTPGYVLYYLVRMLPQYMLRLQNGKFDAPDRLFRSIYITWQGCTTNYTDVKELIPEFYDDTLAEPREWLLNRQALNLGTTQNLQRVDDVELPPWAHGCPNTFIRRHREALECEYVSQHLHEWIDLIFGYKQQGEEAIQADNVYYYLSYEGAVDLETIEDPIQRCSLESQIQEFGQTPKQLFSSAHPPRGMKPMTSKIDSTSQLPKLSSDCSTTSIRFPHQNDADILPPPVTHTRRGRQAIEINVPALGSLNGDHKLSEVNNSKWKEKCFSKSHWFSCLYEPLWQVPRILIDGMLTLSNTRLSNSGKPIKNWNWSSKLVNNRTKWEWTEHIPTNTTLSPLHSGEITCAVLGRDNSTLYSTCKHSCLKVCSVMDGTITRTSNAPAALSCCDVSPDEKQLLVGCWDNRVYMYSLDEEGCTGRELDKVFAHSDGVSAICVMKDRFLTTSWDSTIKLWRYTPQYIVASPIRTFLECDEALLCLDISVNGQWAVAGARNGVVYVFNLNQVVFHGSVHVSPILRGDVASISFVGPSGRVCATSFVCMTLENELIVYTIDGEQLFRVEVATMGQVRCLESDGEFAVGGTTNGKLLFWSLRQAPGREMVYEVTRAHDTIICSLVVASDGRSIVSAAMDGTVRVWRLVSQHEKLPLARKRSDAPTYLYGGQIEWYIDW